MSGRDRGGRGAPGGDRGRGGGGRGSDGGHRGRGDFRGGREDFRGGRGDFRGGRGDFHGGRGDFHGGRGDFRGGRGDRGGPRGGTGGGGGGGRDDDVVVEVYRPADKVIPPPSATVTQAEQDYVKSLTSTGVPDIGGLQVGARFPRRPGFGTKGTNVVLWANYFEFVPPPDLVLYRYKITDVKEQGSKDKFATGKKLKQVFNLILEQPPLQPLRNDIVTDFKAFLFSRTKLTADGLKALPSSIQYKAEMEDEPRPRAPHYQYTFASDGTVSVSELTDFLTSTNANAIFDKGPVTQALNVFLGHYAKASPQHTNIGANKSYRLNQAAASSGNLGAGLTALMGFFSSVRVATTRILVNINVSHAPFYNEVPVVTTLADFSRAHGGNKAKLNVFLQRVRVRTTHLTEKRNRAGVVIPRVKSIFGLAAVGDGRKLEHPPRISATLGSGPKGVEFWLDAAPTASKPGATSDQPTTQSKGKKQGKVNQQTSATGSGKGKQPASTGGKYISVYDFFKTTHRIQVNPDFPVLNVGNKENPSYLPVEVCTIMPGQSSQSKLDPQQTKAMINVAVRLPHVNAGDVAVQSSGTVGLSQQGNVQMLQYGVSIGTKMITVPGRVLRHPQVNYGQDKPFMFPASWNQQDRNRKYFKFNSGSAIPSWRAVMILIEGMPTAFDNANSLDSTVAQFREVLIELGIAAPRPVNNVRVRITGPDDPELEKSLCGFNESLLFVILPFKQTPLYNRIKHIGDTKAGKHTICVVGSNLKKGGPKYFANVALKFNLKLGGRNQAIDSSKLGVISENKTMVVGLDVTHPSPGSAETAPSIAGMVASIDEHLGQWPAIIRLQKVARQEMVSDLKMMLKTRLDLWKTKGKHAKYPENILVYRDGVSEGQYDIVLNTELPLLREACAEVYSSAATKNGLPRMTIAVVGKRHHTRFYPTVLEKGKTDLDNGNCCNGTIVDRHVTEARNWDFFLQAHTALKGTARPAHYFVVLDEIFTNGPVNPPFTNPADVFEDLTHNMCYLFGRATKAVSLCPPAYYADLVCERARCYLAGHFDLATPAITPAHSEGGDGGPGEAEQGDITVHPNLKDTMFYI